MKEYKACHPLETVNKIRGILSNIGILTKDNHTKNNKFFSFRTNIAYPDLDSFNYGTNGKGTTYEYSLASGYAEFLERLQNNLLLPKRKYSYKRFLDELDPNSQFVKKVREKNLELDYLFDKDEEYWSIEKLHAHWGDELRKIFKLSNHDDIGEFIRQINPSEEVLMVPFFDVQTHESIYLPIELLWSATGSNGMCAGNTAQEAVLQGVCELFERYAIKEIYLKELTPPTIPYDAFKGSVAYENLHYILKENPNYEIIIKDCSLGLGLPVIGLIITDKEKHFFNFKLGSDFNPAIALERCINEVYQGTTYFKSIPFKFFDKSQKPDYISDIDYMYLNLKNTFVDSSGYWPASILSAKVSYPFTGFNDKLGNTNEYDLDYSIKLIHNLGFNLYIRDNSKLNFPAYYVVAPGMSELVKNKSNCTLLNLGSKLNYLCNMSNLTVEKAALLADSLDCNYELIKLDRFKYTKIYVPVKDQDLYDLDLELLLYMLFYYARNNDKAMYYLNLFLSDKSRDDYDYYYAISDYMNLRYTENRNDDEIAAILSIGYGKDTANEVVEDISDPEKIFRYHSFPNCFNCEDCKVSDKCRLFDVFQIEKNINVHSRVINQKDLEKHLFGNTQ